MAEQLAVAVAYCRVSTEGQATDGVSLEVQQAKARAWCELNGYSLAAVHADAGISGKNATNRPGLQKALDAACQHKAALVVYSLSRMARSTRDTLAIAERLQKADADLVSLSESLDTTSAAGKMMFRMLAVLAEFERDLVSERTRVAMQHKMAMGERVGRLPFGFDLAPDGVHLIENPKEQAALKHIARLRAARYSLRAIAADLTRRGVPTKCGRGPWAHQTVAAIIEGQGKGRVGIKH